jgi:hypothetical protein
MAIRFSARRSVQLIFKGRQKSHRSVHFAGYIPGQDLLSCSFCRGEFPYILKQGEITEDVSVEMIKPGDRVLVKPGEKVQIDGIVIDGKSSINEAMLTGESKPVSKKAGDALTGGSLNGEGAQISGRGFLHSAEFAWLGSNL